MRKTLALLLTFAAAGNAFAADQPQKLQAAPSNNVEMPPLIAPIIVDGELTGYFYISCKLTASSQSSAIAITNKRAFIQDAFVREVNVRPLTVGDADKVDLKALGNRLIADARAIVGARTITAIIFGDPDIKDNGLKFAALKPDETPSAAPMEDLPVAEAEPAPQKAEKAH